MQRSVLNWAFAAFIAWLAIASFSSINTYQSLITVWMWCGYGLVLYASTVLQRIWPRWIELVAHVSIITAVVLALFSIHAFSTDLSVLAYPRMRGLFDSHNIYASFIIFPMIASWWYAIQCPYKSKKFWAYAAASVLIISQFVLTFSRGTWLACAVAGIVFAVAHALWLKKSYSAKLMLDNKLFRRESVWIILAGLVLSTGIYFHTVKIGSVEGEIVTPYATETVVENGITARLHYMGDGLGLAAGNLGTGVGPGQYEKGIKHWKQDFEFYSANSHNSLINLLAETGIPGLVFGIALALTLLYMCWKVATASNFCGIIMVVIFSILAMLFHSLVDADLEYRAIEILLWALAGCILGTQQTLLRYRPTRPVSILAILVALAMAVAFGFYAFAGSYLDKSKGSVRANPPRAFELALMSQSINPLNPEADIAGAEALMQLVRHATGTQREQIGKDALVLIDHAVSRVDCDEVAELDRFYILNMLNHYEDSVKALRAAIACNPTASHSTYALLVRVLMIHKDMQGALDVIDSVLPKYDRYISSGWFSMTPLQEEIKGFVASLRSSRAEICKNSNSVASKGSVPLRGCGAGMPR